VNLPFYPRNKKGVSTLPDDRTLKIFHQVRIFFERKPATERTNMRYKELRFFAASPGLPCMAKPPLKPRQVHEAQEREALFVSTADLPGLSSFRVKFDNYEITINPTINHALSLP
jgi:hypothetical protein